CALDLLRVLWFVRTSYGCGIVVCIIVEVHLIQSTFHMTAQCVHELQHTHVLLLMAQASQFTFLGIVATLMGFPRCTIWPPSPSLHRSRVLLQSVCWVHFGQ
ncbi:hypothetical protein NPIL_98131, partial [Nephila pilipes]